MNTEINTPVVVEEKKKVRKVSKTKPVVNIKEPKADEVTDAFAEIVAEATGEEVKVEEDNRPDLFAELVAEANKDEVEEEVVENVDAAIAAEEKIIKEAQERTEQLRLKKQLTEKGPEFLEKILQIKKRSLKGTEERMKAAMEAWEKEIAEIEAEIDALEEVEEENVMDFLAENYAIDVNDFLKEIYPDFNKKTETKKETKTGSAKRKTGVVTKTMKPADRWALIEEGTQFRAKQKDFIRYYKKTADGVVECDQTGTIDENSPVYAGNQEAANAFKVAAGISYSISGWEFLQLYNPETEKAKSLKKWDGDVDYLLW
jgi:hypothetical protein